MALGIGTGHILLRTEQPRFVLSFTNSAHAAVAFAHPAHWEDKKRVLGFLKTLVDPAYTEAKSREVFERVTVEQASWEKAVRKDAKNVMKDWLRDTEHYYSLICSRMPA
ncbi:hypothetical protein B0H14DRAFT_2570107 [Mycena olivaceomarginata]|nr:hypothetical protein B0H14DRAFT_2570107 [Mycena olivaceomarginata]